MDWTPLRDFFEATLAVTLLGITVAIPDRSDSQCASTFGLVGSIDPTKPNS